MDKAKGGRPPVFVTEEDFAKAAQEYFLKCYSGEQMPNKAGLCVHLHISRDTYNEYKKRFPDAGKRIEDKIENAWVQRLGGNSPTGAIFYLKNAFAYRDRQETDITSGGKPLPILGGISKQDDLPADNGAPEDKRA